MTKNKTLWFFISIAFLNLGCDDIFEEDISEEIITPIFPVEDAILTSNNVIFQWSDIEKANLFRLQIAMSNNLFVRDTIIDNISFFDTLPEGNYKWRVRAENSVYKSMYSDFTPFSIAEVPDLENKSVFIISSSLDND